jgi:hypothetical protein
MRQQSAQLAEAETLKSFIDSSGCCESCDHLTEELKINRGS